MRDESYLLHGSSHYESEDRLDSSEVEQVIGQFFAQQSSANITVALDGKVLRGNLAEGETQGVHLLAAYVPDTASLTCPCSRPRRLARDMDDWNIVIWPVSTI